MPAQTRSARSGLSSGTASCSDRKAGGWVGRAQPRTRTEQTGRGRVGARPEPVAGAGRAVDEQPGLGSGYRQHPFVHVVDTHPRSFPSGHGAAPHPEAFWRRLSNIVESTL
ncbi:hypothetical protein SL103_10640 [Streptomyces lydicus]|uniref:Uncharacterized protein n=1 Tax=Streptomyces lydicus TaxID=47763 RepID=A0A1D7VIU6_9ACTN|nr:hypothetical protein SL103_10640 [Streptomyces lydicus]